MVTMIKIIDAIQKVKEKKNPDTAVMEKLPKAGCTGVWGRLL
jgi:hypothetical protein